jgi:hypothetical protein
VDGCHPPIHSNNTIVARDRPFKGLSQVVHCYHNKLALQSLLTTVMITLSQRLRLSGRLAVTHCHSGVPYANESVTHWNRN